MSRTPPSPSKPTLSRPRKHSFWASFRVAFSGAVHILRTERNAQIEGIIALVALLLGLWLGISQIEWLVIITLIGLVLGLEMVNTAIEAAVDLAHPDHHPLAKKAKDSAAGAVLVAAIASAVIGVGIFLPRLWLIVANGIR